MRLFDDLSLLAVSTLAQAEVLYKCTCWEKRGPRSLYVGGGVEESSRGLATRVCREDYSHKAKLPNNIYAKCSKKKTSSSRVYRGS